MVHVTMSLVNLPPEVILEISDYLLVDAILALKLSHRIFNETLPLEPRLKNTLLSECSHLAIRTYLSRPNPEPSHIRCILCKTLYPLRLFKSSSSPACVSISSVEETHQTNVVELPQRLCSWHVGMLARVVYTESSGTNEWTSQMDEMCMHCGAIQGWTKCDCDCGSCAIWPARTYTRYLNNNRECKGFSFWRDRENVQEPLMVRETCWDPGESGTSSVWQGKDQGSVD
jgi:hypothetical protein